ncbi:hypothetical protein AB0F71_25370 [Kitasatospora sp. NPDC028055]|uniref:hypothetical protein n=1 Tax=Kitasatospora sp. NPDC028055 TaxID=3155653 RepID=UPI0033CE5EFB
MSVNWGDAPTWVGSLVALGFSVTAWRETRKQRERLEASEQKAETAARLAAEAEADQVVSSLGWNGGSLEVTITNGSVRPVTQVEILDVAPTPSSGCDWASWTPKQQIHPNTPTSWAVISPGQEVRSILWLRDADGNRISQVPTEAEVIIRFCDSAGRWWQRTPDGAAGTEAP